MNCLSEERHFQNIVKKLKNYSIYDEIDKNKLDKNIIKKISILYDLFRHINKERNSNTTDFIYTSDIKYSLKHDEFVRIRFHITPIERKGINSLDENNYSYIQNLNNLVSNIYNPSIYDQFIKNQIEEDKEKLQIMIKCINEIECAYIYKYRSDNNIKLTFDVFCHNFYVFLSYDYKKKLSIKNFKNKYNQIKQDNEFEYSTTQNIMQLNSIGLILKNNDNSFEQEYLEKLNPYIFESEAIIKELHSKKYAPIKKLELENNFFIKNDNYEQDMRRLIQVEKIKNEYRRLKNNIRKNF
ncbi:hypothetical protein MKS88_005000 [Plasmodium brasilianum]|uniref:Uncharacterized protein n=2 Tax=Plasmodium (Plasmodium) TaxID=418103 RepID=A0A1A8X2E1_PLAMA|nr:conserved Plasmodium protein, unknown function [Plasmodium malariae]KAI4835783.1 hypothetical protein MKS88_005000 [Plasmodium brasilianum]SBS98331.1 conserved Plasmodium protein, unknown function [Plasmodium malariae]SBT72293.1 conserved Plasmodium protein, unknown function [Plasmodium malariae]SCP02721.1 conserved Plasmodium protein, unknown function [Plasmodium malariae]